MRYFDRDEMKTLQTERYDVSSAQGHLFVLVQHRVAQQNESCSCHMLPTQTTYC